MTKSKEFKKYTEATAYKAEMKAQGFHSYIEEFYDFDDKFYLVMVW